MEPSRRPEAGASPPPPAADAPRGSLLAEWFRQRPWIWVVVLFVGVVGFNIVMAVIAVMNPPTIVR